MRKAENIKPRVSAEGGDRCSGHVVCISKDWFTWLIILKTVDYRKLGDHHVNVTYSTAKFWYGFPRSFVLGLYKSEPTCIYIIIYLPVWWWSNGFIFAVCPLMLQLGKKKVNFHMLTTHLVFLLTSTLSGQWKLKLTLHTYFILLLGFLLCKMLSSGYYMKVFTLYSLWIVLILYGEYKHNLLCDSLTAFYFQSRIIYITTVYLDAEANCFT